MVEVEIKLKNNRMVMFALVNFYTKSHSMVMKKTDKMGYGRYTITHFIIRIPDGDRKNVVNREVTENKHIVNENE